MRRGITMRWHAVLDTHVRELTGARSEYVVGRLFDVSKPKNEQFVRDFRTTVYRAATGARYVRIRHPDGTSRRIYLSE